MKLRLIIATVVAGALALSVSGAQAARYPVMDGKKVKVLTMTGSGGVQDHDQEAAALSAPDYWQCSSSLCKKLFFVYQPAKGIKGGLMFTATWNQAVVDDIDLYVWDVAKNGSATDVGHCGGVGTASEKVYLAPEELRKGHTYVMMIRYFRSVNAVVNAKVEINVPSTIKETVPAKYDGQLPGTLYPINCTL